MEEELSASLGEWQVTEFIEDQGVEAAEQIGGASLAIGTGLGIELVHEVDDVEDADRALPGHASCGGFGLRYAAIGCRSVRMSSTTP